MKRFILSALALSMLSASALQGQAAPLMAPTAPHSNYTQVDWKKTTRHVEKRHVGERANKRVIVKKHVVAKQPRWKRGQRYSNWRRHERVRDYRHLGLKRPGHGQEWIRVGNDYLLVGIASGIIGGMIAAR